jgi:hypothetical protein
MAGGRRHEQPVEHADPHVLTILPVPVYEFRVRLSRGQRRQKDLPKGKDADLWEPISIGLPVPGSVAEAQAFAASL